MSQGFQSLETEKVKNKLDTVQMHSSAKSVVFVFTVIDKN